MFPSFIEGFSSSCSGLPWPESWDAAWEPLECPPASRGASALSPGWGGHSAGWCPQTSAPAQAVPSGARAAPSPCSSAEPSCAQRCLRSASLVRKCPGISACRRGASWLMRDLLCCFCCDLEMGLRKQNPVREQLSPATSGGTEQLSGANSIQLLRFCCFSRAFKAVLSLCVSTCATENFNPSPPDGYLKTHSPLTKPPCSAGPQAPRFPPLRGQVILVKKKGKRT